VNPLIDAKSQGQMNRKQLILFGTRHWKASDIPSEIRKSLAVLIDEFKPDVGLEEWSVIQYETSGAASVFATKNLPWESIGTPPQEQFRTYGPSDAADFPSGDVNQYGPLAAQEAREKMICGNIEMAMASHQVGLIVIGVAHLHSMLMKLSTKFEVKAYAYRAEFF
jgi:hypothetical protein